MSLRKLQLCQFPSTPEINQAEEQNQQNQRSPHYGISFDSVFDYPHSRPRWHKTRGELLIHIITTWNLANLVGWLIRLWFAPSVGIRRNLVPPTICFPKKFPSNKIVLLLAIVQPQIFRHDLKNYTRLSMGLWHISFGFSWFSSTRIHLH